VPFAAGWPERGCVTVNAGTGAFIQRSTDRDPVASDSLLTGIIYSDPQRVAYTLEGTVNGAGAAIETVARELGVKPEQAFAELDLKRKDVPVFLNGVGGLGSPFWQPDFLSRFEGPPAVADATLAQKLQAVLESVLFLIQANLDELRAASGELNEIVLTGGLSREPAFVQGLADLSGVVVLHPEREEATAHGVAFLLSIDKGRWPDARNRTTPPQENPALVQRYQRWLQAMKKTLI
jgi:glycerol kinase